MLNTTIEQRRPELSTRRPRPRLRAFKI